MAFLIVKGLLLLLGIKRVTKAYNSLRFARGKQESVRTCTCIILQREPSQMLSMLPSPFCITKNRDNAQGDFGCALTLPQTVFFFKDFFHLLASVVGFFYNALQLLWYPGWNHGSSCCKFTDVTGSNARVHQHSEETHAGPSSPSLM